MSRIKSDWELARENLKKSVDLQAKYYNKKHRDVEFDSWRVGVAVYIGI